MRMNFPLGRATDSRRSLHMIRYYCNSDNVCYDICMDFPHLQHFSYVKLCTHTHTFQFQYTHTQPSTNISVPKSRKKMPHAIDVYDVTDENFMIPFIHSALKIYSMRRQMYDGVDFIRNN